MEEVFKIRVVQKIGLTKCVICTALKKYKRKLSKSNPDKKMVEFNSVIIFDAETTSMPHLDHNTTKIIELAFLGCEVNHLKYINEPPRVLHKLILFFNPNKIIAPGATKVSGLDNELLENVKPFRAEDADMLKNFILRLPPPVCIVAHNGDKFDFPILRRALYKLGTVLGENVYCADSIKAFREIYPKTPPSKKPRTATEIQTNLEQTPPNQKTVPVNSLHYKKSDVSRELFTDNEKLEDSMSTPSASSYLSSPKSYKLAHMFEFLYGKNFDNAHRAEVDSFALLNCIIQCKEIFLKWIGSHAVVFDTVPPLF